jgi:hypothetical protein
MKFNQIQKKAGRLVKRHELIAGAAIFLFILLHFVSPFIFIRDKNLSNEITSLKTENKQSAPIETEPETESAEIVKMPVPVLPVVRPESAKPKIAARTLPKKKELPRESRAERLRRAEKILTGV